MSGPPDEALTGAAVIECACLPPARFGQNAGAAWAAPG